MDPKQRYLRGDLQGLKYLLTLNKNVSKDVAVITHVNMHQRISMRFPTTSDEWRRDVGLFAVPNKLSHDYFSSGSNFSTKSTITSSEASTHQPTETRRMSAPLRIQSKMYIGLSMEIRSSGEPFSFSTANANMDITGPTRNAGSKVP